MLIAQTLRFRRILRITWRTDLLMLLTCATAYLIDAYGFGEQLQVPATLPALLGTAIAFFIGFNNNQAYSGSGRPMMVGGPHDLGCHRQ